MAQIQSPETYVDGQQVTASRLNNQTNGAILLPGAVTDQTAISGGVASADTVIVHDASASAIRKATVTELLGGGVPVVASSVTGVAGSDLILAGASGQNVEVSGNLDVTNGLTVVGNATMDAGLNVNGIASFNTTSALKIPVGTTGQRPGTPVAGQIRYNSELDQAEVYSGTEWKAVGGGPFDASGGTVTTFDGYKIHTFTASGTFTPSLTKEGKVEVLVVGAGGAGVAWEKGGGGGGGAVVAGFVSIPKGQAPMTVVVGVGTSTNGGSSSFATFTAGGGFAPITAGWNGGASGSGIAGVNGNNDAGAGGSGASTAQSFRWADSPGAGGNGFGSSISGTLRMYGGGGGGSKPTGQAPGLDGGGGSNGAPTANSGGGGGGGFGHNGADGVVIMRYRVS
jgi:hypothetical protein